MDGLDVTLSGNSLAAPTRKLVKKGKIYDFADDATVNPQNVKVKIARATGLVSGDFSLWTATANGTSQKELKGFKHYGVLTFGRMNGNVIDDLYDGLSPEACEDSRHEEDNAHVELLEAV